MPGVFYGLGFLLRWPTTVTAKSFYSRQHQFCHGKINLATAKSISPRQNQSRHGKINFATAKSISPRQNQFRHGKLNFATAKAVLPRQNQFCNTAKSVLLTTKSFSLTSKYISPRQNHFGELAHVTLARKVLWGSIQHGGVPRGSMTQLDSTCIAPTVAIVYLQPHISACSVDKVSCN